MAEERAAQIFDGGPNNVATMSEYIANIGAVSSLLAPVWIRHRVHLAQWLMFFNTLCSIGINVILVEYTVIFYRLLLLLASASAFSSSAVVNVSM